MQEQVKTKLKKKKGAKNQSVIQAEANADPDDHDPSSNQFLSQLESMNQRVKIYSELFYDREPRFVHASPTHLEKFVKNKQK